MRNRLIIFWFFCLMMFAPGYINGQQATRTVLVSINKIITRNDSTLLLLKGGNKIGIEPGNGGRILSRQQKGEVNFSQTELGYGRVIAVNDTAAMLLLAIKPSPDKRAVAEGDVVEFKIRPPMAGNLFTELAAYAVFFTDMYQVPFYSQKHIWQSSILPGDDDLLEAMADDVKNTAEELKDYFDSTNAVMLPVKGGRYAGKSVMQKMAEITGDDIRSFLLFVISYPGKYIGNTYKINETFATWLLNDAPNSSKDFMYTWQQLRGNPAELRIWLNKQAPLLRKENLATLFADDANYFSIEKSFDSASMAIEQGLSVAYAIRDTTGLAALLLAKAQNEQYQERYALAAEICDSVVYHATLAKDTSMRFQAYFKKAYCLYKTSQYARAHEVLQLAENDLTKMGNLLKKNDRLNHERKRNEYAGWIDFEAGNYPKAIEYFYKGIAVNKELNTADAIDNIASDYWYLGKIYKRQSLYDAALRTLDSSFQIYSSLAQAEQAAFVENDIGHALFSMGRYAESIAMHQKAFATLYDLKSWNNAGYAKSMIAQGLWNENKIAEAIESHREAIGLRRLASNRDGLAFSWKSLGNLYERAGEKNNALLAYDSAAFYYASVADSAQQAQMLLSVGKVCENDKDVAKARRYYDEAATLLKRMGSRSGYIDALYKLASLTFADDAAASEQYYTRCLEEATAINDLSNQLYCMSNLGILAGRKKQMKAAREWFEKALPIAQATADPSMEAYLALRMGDAEVLNLQIAKAKALFRKSAAIYDTLDKAEYFNALLRMGNVHITEGHFDSAGNITQRVISEAAKLGYRLQQAEALQQLSFQYTLQARYAEGLALTDSAERVYGSTGNRFQQGSLLVSRGNLLRGLGRFEEGLKQYNTADSLYLLESYAEGRSTIANNSGVVYFHWGKYREAMQYFKQAITLLPDTTLNESLILAHSNIAECLHFLEANDSALQLLQQYYPLAKQQGLYRMSGGMAMLSGRIYYSRGEPQKALPLVKEALADATQAGLAYRQTEASMYLGMLLKQSDPTTALASMQQAVKLAEQYPMESVGWETYYQLGLYYYEQKNWNKAIETFKQGVQYLENMGSRIYGGADSEGIKSFKSSGKKPELYIKLVSALAAAGRTDEAIAFAQQTQHAALRDMMGDLQTDVNDPQKASALRKLEDLQQQRTGLNQSLQQLEQKNAPEAQLATLRQTKAVVEKEYLNYLTSLVKEYPDIDAYFARNVNPEDFKNNKDMIPDGTVLVLYLLNGRQLLIFTATNSQVGVKEQWLDADLDPMIDEYIAVIANPAKHTGTGPLMLRSTIRKRVVPPATSETFQSLGNRLYEILLAPIAEELKGQQSICIIPNGKLSNLPFQCLGRKINDSTLRYLVEDYTLYYTNKMDVFLRPGRKDKGIESFTAFGNPDKTLESAGTEVKAIGKMLGTNAIYLQDEATESRAKSSLEEKRYVHFATHGVLDYTDFSNSYLKMANVKDGDEDGELRIEEIKSLNISGCDLVTLSACETAVNQELKKGWFISPANAFLVNRVRSVLASLWPVDDNATNLLMQHFYSNLQTMGKAEALRKAQATLSATPGYAHPFYWGGFVLYGDWR